MVRVGINLIPIHQTYIYHISVINTSRRHLEDRSVYCTFFTLSQTFSPDLRNLVLTFESVTKSLPEFDHSNKSSSTVIFLSCNWLDSIRFSPV